MKNSISILGFTTFVMLLIFAAILLLHFRKNKPCSYLLSALFFSDALLIFNMLANSNRLIKNLLPEKYSLYVNGMPLLIGALLYLYTKSITLRNYKFQKNEFVHFTPLLFLYVAYWITYFVSGNLQDIHISINFVKTIFSNIVILFYIIKSLHLLKKYENEIKDYYSFLHKTNLSWLKVILYAFIGLWAIHTVYVISGQYFVTKGERIFPFLALLVNFFFAVTVFSKSIVRPDALHGTEIKFVKTVNGKNNFTESQKAELNRKLNLYMSGEKPYKNLSFTINELAKGIVIPVGVISEHLNKNLGKNFFEFVNEYRIEEAKRKLISNEYKESTILEILYEVGFNSKSVFNSLFKKNTKLTPKEFRRKYS